MREIRESEYRMLDRITDKIQWLEFRKCDYVCRNFSRGLIAGFALVMPIFRESVMRYRYYVREIVTRDHNWANGRYAGTT